MSFFLIIKKNYNFAQKIFKVFYEKEITFFILCYFLYFSSLQYLLTYLHKIITRLREIK